jgi:hypothetical protein
MQNIPMRDDATEQDYQSGFNRIMWFAEQAKLRGWRLSDRQLVHEIMQRERAARIRERSSLPVLESPVDSVAWNHAHAT